MIYSRKAEIDQIAEGLQSFQLLSFLRNNTEIGYHTLHAQKSPALTVDSFLDLFVIHDQAEEGSTTDAVQDGIYLNFSDFAKDIFAESKRLPFLGRPLDILSFCRN